MTKQIQKMANYCASCINKPCQTGCPLKNDIPEFIKEIKQNNYKKSYSILSNTTVLPAICGRICPHPCEIHCIKNINNNPTQIKKLEKFIGDLSIDNNWKISKIIKQKKHNVAIIGGGPAGLTCAAFLAKNGINVTIYEKYNYLGGLLIHGIPSFRLPRKITNETIKKILKLGIKVKYNRELGKNIKLTDLTKIYDAIFIGIGSNIPNKLNIKKEYVEGVYYANEILEKKLNIDYKNKTIIIIGGGNVSIDIARTIIRKEPKKVIILYRGKEEEMKADIKEIEKAKEENIQILCEHNIKKIIGKNKVEKIEVKTPNKPNYQIKCDYVIGAIGSHTDSDITNKLKLKLSDNGKILIDELGHTSNKKIFAGGDVAGIPNTVAHASASGRNAAYEIIKYLEKNNVSN